MIAAKIAKLRPINIFFLEDTLKINNIAIAILRGIEIVFLLVLAHPKIPQKQMVMLNNQASTTMKENFLRKYISNSHANTYVKLRGKY